jgi:hypothetical protein
MLAATITQKVCFRRLRPLRVEIGFGRFQACAEWTGLFSFSAAGFRWATFRDAKSNSSLCS